jgi:hypothetical protein
VVVGNVVREACPKHKHSHEWDCGQEPPSSTQGINAFNSWQGEEKVDGPCMVLGLAPCIDSLESREDILTESETICHRCDCRAGCSACFAENNSCANVNPYFISHRVKHIYLNKRRKRLLQTKGVSFPGFQIDMV